MFYNYKGVPFLIFDQIPTALYALTSIPCCFATVKRGARRGEGQAGPGSLPNLPRAQGSAAPGLPAQRPQALRPLCEPTGDWRVCRANAARIRRPAVRCAMPRCRFPARKM